MKLTTAFAVFVTTMAIASQFDVVASSASVLDETDPPKTRKVRTATILRFIIYTLVSYRIVSYLILSYLLFRLFPIPFVAMTILLNTKIKNGKKDNSPSSGSTGKPNLGSTGLFNYCPGFDADQPSVDHECPGDEISCIDIKKSCKDDPLHPSCLYCYDTKVCGYGDSRSKDRDHLCKTNEIMCHDHFNSYYYCKKWKD